ncbi:MAG: tetratricopeptide repeat protein [Opitutales bacterium]
MRKRLKSTDFYLSKEFIVRASFMLAGALCLILPAVFVGAQAPPLSSSQGQGSSTGGKTGAVMQTGSGETESNAFIRAADRVFDPESDALNFEEGTFSWKGRTFNLSEARVFRARFERYLGTDPRPNYDDYEAVIHEILDELSVAPAEDSEEAVRDTVFDAWDLMFDAAEYEMDGGNSLVIANQVHNAWRIRQEMRESRLSKSELERRREAEESIVANRERMLRSARERQRRAEAESGDNGNGNGNGSDSEGEEGPGLSSEASFRARDLARTIERIGSIEVEQAKSGTQAKLEFQSQIVSLFMQRRFRHVQISAGFYRKTFAGSSQKLEVGTGELENFFPDADMSFTVNTLEYLANEAINDVRTGMEAVENAYESGNKVRALERLQEAFLLGEHLPEVYQFDREKRRDLLKIYRNMRKARELANAKDYNSVERIAGKLNEMADDFPAASILGAINTARSASNFAVFAAEQYRSQGNIDRARDELKRAIEIWPTNPRIREFQTDTTAMTNRRQQAVDAFDSLVEQGAERRIHERRNELGVALIDDDERLAQLEEIVNRFARIEMLLSQSEEMKKQDNFHAAWDLLEEAAALDDDDSRVNRARAELAPRVSEYVRMLDAGERNEEEGRHAAALARYLNAQDIYPASRISREGIERSSEAIMNDLRDARGEKSPDEASASVDGNGLSRSR